MVSNLTKFVTYARHHGVRSALKTAVTRVLYSGPQPVKVAAARNGKIEQVGAGEAFRLACNIGQGHIVC